MTDRPDREKCPACFREEQRSPEKGVFTASKNYDILKSSGDSGVQDILMCRFTG
jgi:hypothetical protein